MQKRPSLCRRIEAKQENNRKIKKILTDLVQRGMMARKTARNVMRLTRRANEKEKKDIHQNLMAYDKIHNNLGLLTSHTNLGTLPNTGNIWTTKLRVPLEYANRLKMAIKEDFNELPNVEEIIKAFEYLRRNTDIFIETKILTIQSADRITDEIFRDPDSVIRVKKEFEEKLNMAKKREQENNVSSAESILKTLDEVA